MVGLTEIAGRRVLFVMAADAEYGPHLRRRFAPLMTGVGPVEAGVVLGAELGRRQVVGELPDLVVSLGSAGSRTLEQTGIYQAVLVSYRDMDASPLGFEKGRTPFLDLPAIVPLPLRVPGIPTGHAVHRRRHRLRRRLWRGRGRHGRHGDLRRAPRVPAVRPAADRAARHLRRRGRARPCRTTGPNICMSSTRSSPRRSIASRRLWPTAR